MVACDVNVHCAPCVLRTGCFICDEKLSLKQLLRATPHEMPRRELPLLDLWIGSFSNETINVVSNVLSRNRSPYVNALVQERNVNGCGLGGPYHLTRIRRKFAFKGEDFFVYHGTSPSSRGLRTATERRRYS